MFQKTSHILVYAELTPFRFLVRAILAKKKEAAFWGNLFQLLTKRY
jgi:hypothetical protein